MSVLRAIGRWLWWFITCPKPLSAAEARYFTDRPDTPPHPDRSEGTGERASWGMWGRRSRI